MKCSVIFLLLLGILPLLPIIYAQDNSIMVPFAETRPTIDGKFTSHTEWTDANVTSFNSNGIDFYLLAKQDRSFVYLMLDGVDFQTDPRNKDVSVRYQATLCFDGNNDSGSQRALGDFCHTSTVFNEFGKEVRGENAPIKFDSEGKSSHLDLPNKFKTGWSYGSQNDPFVKYDHLMFEAKIPRTLFESLADVGFTFEMYAGSSPTDVVQLINGAVWPPESDKRDPSTWGKLILPEIGCPTNLELVFKYDDTPACVFLGTYSKLVERGWAKYDATFLDLHRQQILSKLREGPQNIYGIFKNFLVSEALKDNMLDEILSDADYQVNCCTYSLDGNSYPYPLSIGITFQIDEKQMITTAEYDLQQEQITGIETSPIRTSGLVSFSGATTKPYDNFTTIEPNTMQFFYYPDPSETKDKYKLFMLIRLPEWMGGAENNTSAFRAYSAKSLDDPCIVKYWGDEGRQRIENPCQGGMYRVIDGALTYGAIHRSTAMTALPYLDLSMDENGMLYVEPPTFSKDENGVIGYGRDMTMAKLRQGSEFLIQSFAKHYPEYPAIPVDFAGYLLSEISPEKYRTTVRYLDFQSKSGYITMTIDHARYGSDYNFAEPNTEFWQIGSTIIKISDSKDYQQNYVFEFKDSSKHFTIEGQNKEFILHDIVRNFFSEYNVDDMFLVSSTME
ncbi:MAG: hypothetical protein K5793_02145 [Nitrosarchaeum sp.]|nr:hypothetical protein [Nitrosarchaeum sp.]